MQRVPDPYRVLGISREATMAEVRAAHRRLAKRYHPDAPHADAARFLAVQDAYELLRDPLRRRDWDRQHAPGPVRAEPTPAEPRRRRTATADGPTDASPSARSRRRKPASTDPTFGPNDRPPHADTWTWTAEGVPWWEDAGSARARRTSRRRSTGGAADGPASTVGDEAGRPSAQAAPGEPAPAGRGARPRPATAAGEASAAEARNDFDVYSRSSGAAWSSASRAYFRRRAADMPSGAANPNTPRWTTPVGAPPPRRYETGAAGTGDRSAVAPPEPVASPGRTGPGPVTSPRPEGARAADPPPVRRPRSVSSVPTATPAEGVAPAQPVASAQPAMGASPVTARRAVAAASAQPAGASRSLGAALAALFRRGDR